MNVLSLFDGMSCGQIALERAGITVNKYYSAEIDGPAVKVAKANYPGILNLGNVINWRKWGIDWSKIGLLIAGSPCQGFSFAGKQLAFDDPRSKLFFVFVDILNHIKKLNPDVKFLLENVKMTKENRDIITKYVGVDYVLINSSRVSAQNRERYYWGNWKFDQPKDKGIVLADIIEKDVDLNRYIISDTMIAGFLNSKSIFKERFKPHNINRPKSYCLTARYFKCGKTDPYLIIQRPRGYNKGGIKGLKGKCPTLSANSWQQNNVLFTPQQTIRKLTPIECERLQTVPDNYTNHVSNTQRYKMLGNGWTVDVIVHILKFLNVQGEKK